MAGPQVLKPDGQTLAISDALRSPSFVARLLEASAANLALAIGHQNANEGGLPQELLAGSLPTAMLACAFDYALETACRESADGPVLDSDDLQDSVRRLVALTDVGRPDPSFVAEINRAAADFLPAPAENFQNGREADGGR